MKVERIDALHFYVKDLEQSVKFFSEVIGNASFVGPITKETTKHRNRVAISKAIGSVTLVLTQPTTPDDPMSQWINEHGEGLASLGLKVPDLEEAVAELLEKGFKLKSKSTGNVKVSVEGKQQPGDADLKVATLWAPGNAYGGLQFYLLQYEEVSGFALASLRKLGDLPRM